MKLAEVVIDDWAWDIENECPWQINIKDFRDDGNRILGCLKPIPLTPEILEKNGFKKDEKVEEMYYLNWGIGNDCVSYDKETGIVRIFHVFGHLVFVLPLSYVHELQHALRLCGIKKEIML